MILEFSVKNYRSFRDKQTFSMIPDVGKKEDGRNIYTLSPKYKFLKSAVIYGANASGKSNFIRALGVFSYLVESGTNRKPGEDILGYDPFKFQSNKKKEPTRFELDFLHDGIRFTYFLAVNKTEIVEEGLVYYPSEKHTKLFLRKGQKFSFGESLKGKKKIIKELTTKNQLFLTKGAENNIAQLAEVYLHIKLNYLVIYHLDTLNEIQLRGNIIEQCKKSNIYRDNFLSLMRSFDTGISDFDFQKKEMVGSPDFYEINTRHPLFDSKGKKVGTEVQNFREESTGTQRLFILGGLILEQIMDGGTIIIDEFQRNLHPNISSFLIDIFNNPEINVNGAQLIVSTHDTNLLSGNDLRRDQIWIVEKDNQGASELFSLADSTGILKNANFEKWYLSGKFGGLPGIESLNFELNFKHEAEEGETAKV